MGFNQSCLAILGKTPERVLEELQLKMTGEKQEFPDAKFVGGQLPSGWYLINTEDSESPLIRQKSLAMISVGCEAIACSVEEHVMVSSAQGWRDGKRVWSVVHNAQEGIEHLEVAGDLPSVFVGLRDELLCKQAAAGGRKAGVDYIFDVPVELARSITGYRYDKDVPGLEGDAFDVLEYGGGHAASSAAPARKSFLQRLFGR